MMPDWVTRQYEPLGFPKRYNTPGLSAKQSQQRYQAKKRWRREHDASFREAERVKRRERERDRRKNCPTCGKMIGRRSKRCVKCHMMEKSRAATKPERLWWELNTPYQDGSNRQHEANVQRLNQLSQEKPL